MSNISETAETGNAEKQELWHVGEETYFHASRKGGTTMESMPLISVIANDDPFATEIALVWKSSGKVQLVAASPALLASCKELRDTAAAAFRALSQHPAAWERFLDECRKAGVKDGVGIRADAAIAKATTS